MEIIRGMREIRRERRSNRIESVGVKKEETLALKFVKRESVVGYR